jgi:hypothetical protein
LKPGLDGCRCPLPGTDILKPEAGSEALKAGCQSRGVKFCTGSCLADYFLREKRPRDRMFSLTLGLNLALA